MPKSPLELAVARRLQAIREELGLKPPQLAKRLGAGRTRYLNWEAAANLPNELMMVRLTEMLPVTLDYIYRGVLDGVPMRLAIRLAAREKGLNPDAPDFRAEQALADTEGSGKA